MTKTQDRIKRTAEVFTPSALVEEMLDKLPQETWQDGKTFLDNSCGDGNFLVAVLARKLRLGHHDPLRTIYGVDIMPDNIQDCRCRLLTTLESFGITITRELVKTALINIRWLSLSRYPAGSLDYDFSFRGKPKRKQVERLLSLFRTKKVA